MLFNKKKQGVFLAMLLLFGVNSGASDFSSLLKQVPLTDTNSILSLAEKLVNGQAKPEFGSQLTTLLSPLISQGNSQAELLLGKAMKGGLAGVTKDPERGFDLLERAAGKEGKNPEAQYELGKSYFEGAGTDKNLISAYMWTSLSLDGTGSYLKKAKALKQKLSTMLNKEQLKKANQLVQQLKPLFSK